MKKDLPLKRFIRVILLLIASSGAFLNGCIVAELQEESALVFSEIQQTSVAATVIWLDANPVLPTIQNQVLVSATPKPDLNESDSDLPCIVPIMDFADICGGLQRAHCTPAQMRYWMGINFKEFTELPGSFAFAGAYGNPYWASLYYTDRQNKQWIRLAIFVSVHSLQNFILAGVDLQEMEDVRVDDFKAHYLKGEWKPCAESASGCWASDKPGAILFWQEEALNYRVQYGSFEGGKGSMSQDDLIFAASRMQTAPAAVNIPVAHVQAMEEQTYFNDVIALAHKNGLPVSKPTGLADGFELVNVEFSPDIEKILRLYYADESEIFKSYLIKIAKEPHSKLGLFEKGNALNEEEDLAFKTVPDYEVLSIKGLKAQFVQGLWVKDINSSEPIWQASFPALRLRFKTDGLIYELAYYGEQEPQNKAALIRLAEALIH
ncbi:MAG: hypothetical protein VB108_00730 [Anaerolineaceae bacterium]|nr:hypothetical protein [Anaerolineaceae bacterium]